MMIRNFLRSFVYAANGIRVAIKEEKNLRFHLCTTVYVFIFSCFYPFGKVEYALLTVLVAGVMALELVNSALERAVSRPSPERYVTAGAVKDMAAGAVFIFSCAAAVCGILLFWDTAVFARIFDFFSSHIILLVLLLLSFVASGWFVLGFGPQKAKKERK